MKFEKCCFNKQNQGVTYFLRVSSWCPFLFHFIWAKFKRKSDIYVIKYEYKDVFTDFLYLKDVRVTGIFEY